MASTTHESPYARRHRHHTKHITRMATHALVSVIAYLIHWAPRATAASATAALLRTACEHLLAAQVVHRTRLLLLLRLPATIVVIPAALLLHLIVAMEGLIALLLLCMLGGHNWTIAYFYDVCGSNNAACIALCVCVCAHNNPIRNTHALDSVSLRLNTKTIIIIIERLHKT